MWIELHAWRDSNPPTSMRLRDVLVPLRDLEKGHRVSLEQLSKEPEASARRLFLHWLALHRLNGREFRLYGMNLDASRRAVLLFVESEHFAESGVYDELPVQRYDEHPLD